MSRRRFAGLRRTWTVFGGDLAYHLRRPFFFVWAFLLAWLAWRLSSGGVQISSGDAAVGGTKAHITSEFALAMQLSIFTILFYGFFIAVAAGMTIIQDEEWRLGELLHATPLRPGEYVRGKFAAVLLGCMIVLGIHLASMMFFNHVLPNAEAEPYHGAFSAANYLMPALVFSMPTIVFLAGFAFAVGEWTRRPVAVFLLPVLIVLVDSFFIWEWAPSWLDPRIDRALMLIDPAGFRWLNETWLKVDRGVAFYNTATIPMDAGFLASRVVIAAMGLGAVAASSWHFGRNLRGAKPGRRALARRPMAGSEEPGTVADPATALPAPLASLGMTMRRPGLLSTAWHVARTELAELRSSPGIYLFSPLMLLLVLTSALVDVGFLDTSLLVVPSGFAVASMGTLTTCLCLLLMFYGVESLERERKTRLGNILQAAPFRSGAVLLGKAVALIVVAAPIILAVALGGVIAMLIQQQVRPSITPFLLYWGLLLVPTIALWIAFVMAIHSLTQSRYTTYAVSLGVIMLTGYGLGTDQLNWVGNWPLWRAVRPSDMSVMELDRRAMVLSRVMAIGLASSSPTSR